MDLMPKHKVFADIWLTNGFNGKQAAIGAGYSVKTSDKTAVDILKRPEVQAYIAKQQKKASNKMELTRERVLQELTRMALFDPRKMFAEDGSLLNIHEMDEDTARCIVSMEVDKVVKQIKRKQDDGEEITQEEVIAIINKKVKTTSKEKAIELSMRHFGMLQDNLALTGANGGPIMVGVMTDEQLEAIIAAKPVDGDDE